jgi:hypothetical protein
VWAHDDARKSLKIAGAEVLEEAKLAVGGSYQRFAEVEPKDDSEVVEGIKSVLASLAAPAAVLEAASAN